MTCKEKLKMDHPEWDDYKLGVAIGSSCPSEFGYPEDAGLCAGGNSCVDCWDAEIPEETTKIKSTEESKMVEDVNTTVIAEPVIKDSGNRREFESGAVRDMQEGKGRFDLVPLEIVSDMLGTTEINHDPIVLDIATFMYDHDTCWLAAALENFATVAYNDCLYTMFLEVAKHFEEGAKKYSPDNWRKGIPVNCYIDSAVRHYMKWRRGDNDEPHDKAFCWNVMCCMWEVEYGEEWRKSGGNKENK